MKTYFTIILFFVMPFWIKAQDVSDPEFPKKEFINHLRLHNGMVTNFKGSSSDVYIGGLQMIPQFTLVQNKIRGGIVLGGFFANKKINALVGPTVSFKLKTIQAGMFGSGGNIHLSFEHLWGTQQQRLFGGGIHVDLGNILVIGLMVHRDYRLNSWWIQNGIGIRISKLKKVKPI